MPRGVYSRRDLSEKQLEHLKKIGYSKGLVPWNKEIKGYSTSKKGTNLSEEQKKKISESLKGRKAWNKDKKGVYTLSQEVRKKIGDKMRGEKNYNWKGGKEHTKVQRTYYELERKLKAAGRARPDICELCGRGGRICFDHDHATGKFRGWICHKCNAVLGFVNDNPELLEKLAEYLRINKSNIITNG